MNDVEIDARKKAISMMVRLEGLLLHNKNSGENKMFLVFQENQLEIVPAIRPNDKLLCKIFAEDCLKGFTATRWHNILHTLIQLLKENSKKGVKNESL